MLNTLSIPEKLYLAELFVQKSDVTNFVTSLTVKSIIDMLPQLWQNFQNIAVFKTIFKNTLSQLVNQKHVKLDYFFWKLHLKLMLFFLS